MMKLTLTHWSWPLALAPNSNRDAATITPFVDRQIGSMEVRFFTGGNIGAQSLLFWEALIYVGNFQIGKLPSLGLQHINVASWRERVPEVIVHL